MKRLKLAVVALFCAAVPAALAHSAGPPPAHTGAPGELTCQECHSTNALNSGAGLIHVDGVPPSYDPGQQYTITVRVAHPDRRRWGFQISAYTESLDTAGTFTITDAVHTKKVTDDGKTFVEHTNAGTYANTANGTSWSFTWTAPAAGTGPVTFYAAGNAANNNGADTGDNIYATFVETSTDAAAPPFADVTTSAGLDPSAGARAVAWGDMDGDGDADLFLGGAGAGKLYRNDAGHFADASGVLGGGGADAAGAAWGDMDGDGRPDLLVATSTGPKLYRNAGSGLADTTAAAGLSAVAGPIGAAAWADADADGALDLLLATPSGVVLLHNDGHGAFADATAAASIPALPGVRTIAWGDYDADGRGDMLVTSTGATRLLRGSGGGAFADATASAGLGAAPAGARDAAWADYDGDLDLDLFVLTDASLLLYRNNGAGVFADATAGAGVPTVGGASLAVDDADGDGSPDLFVTGPGADRYLRFNLTSYADDTSKAGIDDAAGVAAVWADFDGDGHVDLLRASDAGVELWRNPSTASTVTVRALTDGDNDASDTDTASDRDAIGATVALDDNNNFLTGLRQVRVIDGGGSSAQAPQRAVFSAVSGALVGVRATFADGEGRQASATVASATSITLRDPRAARVDAVLVKTKNGTEKLVVDGARFVTDAEKIEVNGRALATTKYPSKKRLGDGTSTRVVGTDASFDAVVPPGRAVLVTTYDDATGARSAPYPFTR